MDDRRPLPANSVDDDFRRFFSQLLRDSREASREPVAHPGNRRFQFRNAIVNETFLRSFFLRARHSEPRNLLILLQSA